MTRNLTLLAALGAAVALSALAAQADTNDLELIEVQRIWDEAPHNAFTDLIRFEGVWYCAFREGEVHGNHPTGQVRVIRSEDGEEWESTAVMQWDGGDVRDPKLSITAEGKLMLTSAVYFTSAVDDTVRQSVTWLTSDGEDWGSVNACLSGVNTWRWNTTWHNGMGYNIGYSGKDAAGTLYRTRDGKQWETLLEDYFPEGEGNETSLVFGPDDTAYCLLRDGPGGMGHLGVAEPPYSEWTWADLGARIGGPEMIRLSDGRFLAAVRLYDGGARTSLCWIDPDEGTIREFLELPSGGDTSYAGLVEHEGVIWMSYYSSHEEKSAIYLARLNIPG